MSQPIPGRQLRPAVVAFHEFVAEAESKFVMLAEVADLPDVHFVGNFLTHPDSVGVIETESLRHNHSTPCHRSTHVLFVSNLQSVFHVVAEKLFSYGTGVIDVKIDVAGEKGFPENLRAAQTLPDARPLTSA